MIKKTRFLDRFVIFVYFRIIDYLVPNFYRAACNADAV